MAPDNRLNPRPKPRNKTRKPKNISRATLTGPIYSRQPPRGPRGGGSASLSPLLIANKQLSGAYSPVLDFYKKQMAQIQAKGAADAAQKQAAYAAYAKWYSSHVPQQIQGIYQGAANDQVGFAKGFSDGMKIAQDQTAGEANKIMGAAGSPAEQQINPTSDASDVLYGVGGFIPGSKLSTQGAAFSSAAALMPGALIAEGGRQGRAISEATAKELAPLREAQVKLRADMASDKMKQLTELYNNGQITQRAYARALGVKNWRSYPNKPLAAEHAKVSASVSKLVGYLVDEYGQPILGKGGKLIHVAQDPNNITFTDDNGGVWLLDKNTGSITPLTRGNGPTPKVVGSDKTGRRLIDPLTGDTLKVLTSPVAGSTSGRTVDPVVAAKAAEWAKKAYYRTVPSKGKPRYDNKGNLIGGGGDKKRKAMSWRNAVNYVLSHLYKGTPRWVAEQALAEFYKPGEYGRPKGSAAATGGVVTEGYTIPASFNPTHQTDGLAGFPATDWFKPAGSVVGAPVSGKIVRVSGGAGSRGDGIYGWSLYLQGDDGSYYFLTHFGSIFVKDGQRIGRGQRIGTVAPYGNAAHIHVGRRSVV